MHANITIHATGTTIHQHLENGVAHINLNTDATGALRDFMLGQLSSEAATQWVRAAFGA